jgi:hypothetical protein
VEGGLRWHINAHGTRFFGGAAHAGTFGIHSWRIYIGVRRGIKINSGNYFVKINKIFATKLV